MSATSQPPPPIAPADTKSAPPVPASSPLMPPTKSSKLLCAFSTKMENNVTTAYTAAARHTLREAHEKIIHCLNQLDDAQVNWRPFEQQNSIANVILHLCGNLRQWAVAGVEQLPDARHRPSEFSDRRPYTRAELLTRLADVVRAADAAIARVTEKTILEPRRI